MRRTELLETTLVDDGHPAAHGHRLDLIVGDVKKGAVEATVEIHQLGARVAAQLGIEVAQRLVHQEHRRSAHDGPSQGDPLPLTAAELAGLAAHVIDEPENLGGLAGLGSTVGPVHPTHLEGELDVALHRLVGVERVALEHHRNVALLGLDIVDPPIADVHVAGGGVFEAGNHAQQGALPTARRTEKDHELVVVDLEGHVVDGRDLVGTLAESLGDVVETYGCHLLHRTPSEACAVYSTYLDGYR